MTAAGAAGRRHAELERWYRRLLRAYPMGYRRTHGDEILAMLMDAAEPGRRRPARADVVDLVRGALRQWFRLPVGRLPVVAAVLAAVVLGGVGAAAGSWVAWRAAELPSDAAAVQTARTVTGADLAAPSVQRSDGLREYWQRVDVSDYEQVLPQWTLEAAQNRLRADGWVLGPAERSSGHTWRGDEQLDDVYDVFQATRGEHTVTVYASTILDPELAGTRLSVTVHLARPGWEPAAIALGWLLGGVTGWLLTGWASYRLRRRALPRRLAAVALGLTALGLAAHPTIGLYETVAELPFAEPGVYGAAPPAYWIVGRPTAELVAATLMTGILILALAATGRKRPEPQPTASPG